MFFVLVWFLVVFFTFKLTLFVGNSKEKCVPHTCTYYNLRLFGRKGVFHQLDKLQSNSFLSRKDLELMLQGFE